MANKRTSQIKKTGKVRYGVVGLGYIAQSAILPAFANAKKNSELVALVSDDPTKLRTLGRKYGAKTFSYADYGKALSEVDAVFIALPNTLHRAYTELAAAAKVHVLCEKPLAMDVDDCEKMIDACASKGVRLMTAYRLHFERTNLEAVEIARKKLGTLRMFTASFANKVEAGNIRLQEGEGGPLFDIGIYCLNAARAVFAAEPVEVSAFAASSADPRFHKVPEMVSVMMKFPDDRLASFTCSFGAASTGWYEVTGTKASLRVDPAYEIAEDLCHFLTVDGKTRTKTNKARDQFAPEILYFSDCILSGRDPEPSGREGLADVRVMNAIEQSITQGGRPVKLETFVKSKRPNLTQEISRPVAAEPDLVHAAPPSGG
jgi:predicted dehydrogenase